MIVLLGNYGYEKPCSLQQWDKDKQIHIYAKGNGEVLEVRMTNNEANFFVVPIEGVGGSVRVHIPNFLLKSFGVLTVSTLEIDENGNQVEQKAHFNIEKREKPEDYTEGANGIITLNDLKKNAGGDSLKLVKMNTYGSKMYIYAGDTIMNRQLKAEVHNFVAGEDYPPVYISAWGEWKEPINPESPEGGYYTKRIPLEWHLSSIEYDSQSEPSSPVDHMIQFSLTISIKEAVEQDLEVMVYSNLPFWHMSM